MSEARRWQTGTTVVLQEVWRGRLWSARPMTVVDDRGDSVVLWCPQGTRWKTAATPPTRPRAPTRAERFVASLTRCDWVLSDFAWEVSTLVFMPSGAWHAVWVSWRDSGDAWGWYINLQRPFGRTERHLQTMDLMLDVIIELDRQWRWKDEDEFDALVSANLIEATEAARVRDEAHRVIACLEANDPPFCDPWHEWRPDPSWPLPELPDGWGQI